MDKKALRVDVAGTLILKWRNARNQQLVRFGSGTKIMSIFSIWATLYNQVYKSLQQQGLWQIQTVGVFPIFITA